MNLYNETPFVNRYKILSFFSKHIENNLGKAVIYLYILEKVLVKVDYVKKYLKILKILQQK